MLRGVRPEASLVLRVTLQSSGDSHRLTQTSSQYRLKKIKGKAASDTSQKQTGYKL